MTMKIEATRDLSEVSLSTDCQVVRNMTKSSMYHYGSQDENLRHKFCNQRVEFFAGF